MAEWLDEVRDCTPPKCLYSCRLFSVCQGFLVSSQHVSLYYYLRYFYLSLFVYIYACKSLRQQKLLINVISRTSLPFMDLKH